MLVRNFIIALFLTVSFGFLASANAQAVDVQSVIDLMNQNFEIDQVGKNHATLQVTDVIAGPYKLIYTVSEKGLEITFAIKTETLKNPSLLREALSYLRSTMDQEIMSSMPWVMTNDPAEANNLTIQKEDLAFKLNTLFSNYKVPRIQLAHRSFNVPLVVADLQANARLGSIIAQSTLAVLDLEFQRKYNEEIHESPRLDIDAEIKKVKSAAQKEQLRREKLYRDPVRAAARDQARLNTKLDDLLKNNDREGVAQFFEKMTPWELMEPLQITTWKNWIESIRHPSKDTITMYRGLDKHDHLIKNQSNNQVGLFAAMVNRNQGSYSDRIRSLAKLFLLNRNKDLMNGTGQLFWHHSQDINASPYISFSLDIKVAGMFADNGLIAVQIDRRRAVLNSYSSLKAEVEFLVPLIIFPDEIKGVFSGNLLTKFDKIVPKAIGVKAPKTFKKLSENGKVYSDFYKFVSDTQTQTLQPNSCSKVFAK